jgi:hypothetical protein
VYNFQADQPPILIRLTDSSGDPVTDPANPLKYSLKYLPNETGTVLPTVGVIVEF